MPIQTEEQAQNVHGVVPAAVGSYGGGEDFGSPFGGGAGSPPGTTNEAAVPYGGPPSAYPPPGGGNGGNGGPGPVVSTDTGSGGSGSKPPGIYTTHLVDLFNEITGGNVLEGGIGNLRELSRDTLSGSDLQTMKNLENLDTNTWNIGDTNKGFNWSSENPGTVNWNINPSNKFTADVNPLGTSYLGFQSSFADGGPVGLMSLPQGYANGGEVIEGEDTMEELTPFGGTRERVIDQVEAFDNAPQHIEEPQIGMYGEKVPLSTARRVQEYMEGLDPVKRNLIQEMMEMFRMKKMRERMQDKEQSGQFFGPQPNEYAI